MGPNLLLKYFNPLAEQHFYGKKNTNFLPLNTWNLLHLFWRFPSINRYGKMNKYL